MRPMKGSAERAQQLAEADVRITSALLALGRDVALGRSKPSVSIDDGKLVVSRRTSSRTLVAAMTGDLEHMARHDQAAASAIRRAAEGADGSGNGGARRIARAEPRAVALDAGRSRRIVISW